jgi:hypothetical protein
MTSNPDHIKSISILLCQTPIMEFKDISEKCSHLLMVINFNYNVKLKSKEQVQEELKFCKPM